MSKASDSELPKSVDPYRLAEQNSALEGVIPLSGMSRFQGAIRGYEEGAVCRVSLSFGMDDERRRIVSGELEAPVKLECQRCLTTMATTLVSRFSLGLVTTDEQAQRLPKDLEPFLTDDFSADLWSLVEDELLLVLPPFPLHDRNECPARDDLEAYEPDGTRGLQETPRKENPFSVLADLKKTKH